MTSPAGWIRYYFSMRDSIGAPALDFIDTVGRRYDEFCFRCKHKHRHCTAMQQWVCGSCGEAWRYVDVALFKGEVDRPIRPTSFDHKYGRMFDIGKLITEFTEDRLYGEDGRLYIAQVVLGKTPRQLAVEVPEAWPDFKPVHHTTIYRRLKRAADEWARRVRQAGLPTE